MVSFFDQLCCSFGRLKIHALPRWQRAAAACRQRRACCARCVGALAAHTRHSPRRSKVSCELTDRGCAHQPPQVRRPSACVHDLGAGQQASGCEPAPAPTAPGPRLREQRRRPAALAWRALRRGELPALPRPCLPLPCPAPPLPRDHQRSHWDHRPPPALLLSVTTYKCTRNLPLLVIERSFLTNCL